MIMRFIFCSLLGIGSIICANAQTPRFFCSNYPLTTSNLTFYAGDSGQFQTIYYPSNFPGAPAGVIPHVYIRAGFGSGGPAPVVYYDFTVKMGYTSATAFTYGSSGKDNPKTGLTTVFHADTFIMQGADTPGNWVKIPLNRGNFVYNGTQNFVVDISTGPPKPLNGVSIIQSNLSGGAYRTLSLKKNAPEGNPVSGRFMDFGFDIMTTGIGELTNITTLSLYPNPADGRFSISFNARRPVRNIGITVVNSCGQKIFGRHYAGTGSTFMTDIALSDAPAGVYFVRLDADGEVLTRSVVVK